MIILGITNNYLTLAIQSKIQFDIRKFILLLPFLGVVVGGFEDSKDLIIR